METTQTPTTRVEYTPTLVAALRKAARAADALAARLEAEPGDGIGLAYAGPRIAFSEADEAMRHYQNDLQ